MSDEIYERFGITVTRYCGPAAEITGIPDRARWQITIGNEVVSSLLRDEIAELAAVILVNTADGDAAVRP